MRCDICHWDPTRHILDHWTLVNTLRHELAATIADGMLNPSWEMTAGTVSLLDRYKVLGDHQRDVDMGYTDAL